MEENTFWWKEKILSLTEANGTMDRSIHGSKVSGPILSDKIFQRMEKLPSQRKKIPQSITPEYLVFLPSSSS